MSRIRLTSPIWCGLFAILAGCCSTTKNNPTALSQEKHLLEAQGYEYIHPVSTEIYDMIFQIKSTTISGIGHSLKEKFGDVPDLVKYAEKILNQEGKASELWEEQFAELRKAISGGGFICEYKWSDGQTEECGLLVLKAGKVVTRQPWLTEYLSKPSASGRLHEQSGSVPPNGE